MAFLTAAVCLSVLVLAALLKPSPEGFGTHTGHPLRLSSCGWLERTGIPCPACGMTTSFAWFVRGNVAASLYVQPMGCLLALLATCSIWGCGYIALTGRPIYRLLWAFPSKYYYVPLLCLAVAGWAWKVFIHLHGIDGWK